MVAADFLSRFILHYEKILIVGDFNIHICCNDKPLVKDFLNVIESFDLKQFVSGPTHQYGHILDLVLGYGLSVSKNGISVLPILDHSVLIFDIMIPNLFSSEKASPNTRLSRYKGPEALNDLNLMLPSVVDSVLTQSLSVDCVTENFNSALLGVLDLVAPAKSRKCSRKNPMPWLNDNLLSLRKNCRKQEHQWRHSNLEGQYQTWQDSLTTYQSRMSAVKAAYYSNLILNNKHNPRLLFDTVSKLTQDRQPVISTDISAQDFIEYFNNRVEDIGFRVTQSFAGGSDFVVNTRSSTDQGLSVFEPTSLATLTKIAMAARNTTCSLDPLPAWVVKELWPTLGLYILDILNLSLATGVFPSCFKTAVGKPLLKKLTLDASSLANYRPVSNLVFFIQSL